MSKGELAVRLPLTILCSIQDCHRDDQIGLYLARILKRKKLVDLEKMQSQDHGEVST
jgi:hypothetical protein